MGDPPCGNRTRLGARAQTPRFGRKTPDEARLASSGSAGFVVCGGRLFPLRSHADRQARALPAAQAARSPRQFGEHERPGREQQENAHRFGEGFSAGPEKDRGAANPRRGGSGGRPHEPARGPQETLRRSTRPLRCAQNPHRGAGARKPRSPGRGQRSPGGHPGRPAQRPRSEHAGGRARAEKPGRPPGYPDAHGRGGHHRCGPAARGREILPAPHRGGLRDAGFVSGHRHTGHTGPAHRLSGKGDEPGGFAFGERLFGPQAAGRPYARGPHHQDPVDRRQAQSAAPSREIPLHAE